MKYDQYISLIQSLEVTARTNPRIYEFKVLLLTVLGYAYFVGLIILLLAPLPVLAVGIWFAPAQMLMLAKLWWVIVPGAAFYLGFLGSAVRAITAKVSDPAGTELKKKQAPELFAFVSHTARELKSRKPAKILIDDSFNAGVLTMPRFGIFGRKVLLVLGLPLMKAVSPDQLKAILAHEMGHISGKHGAFSKWAYQMREAWGRLIDSQEETGHKFDALYKKFVEWFFPYFTAYSFVLMREHEKSADLDAASLVGARPLGEALIVLETKSRVLNDEFWANIHKENLKQDAPPEKMFTRMLASLSFFNAERVSVSLKEAVEVPTDFNDSHPALGDRLRMIGYWVGENLPDLPPPVETDAATAFLGRDVVDRYAADFDKKWDEDVAKTWKDKYEHFRESDKVADELQKKRGSGEATREELVDLAQLISNRDGMEASIPVIEEIAERFPEEASSWYNLAFARLFKHDDSGLEYLEKAVSIDSNMKYDAAQLAFDYLRGKGRIEEAKKHAALLDEQSDVIEKANKERREPTKADNWSPHDLPSDFTDQIPKKLAGLEEIDAVYIANKQVRYLPEYPFRVIFIELRGRRKGDASPEAIVEIVAERLADARIHYFVLLNEHLGDTGKKLDAIEGTLAFDNRTK